MQERSLGNSVCEEGASPPARRVAVSDKGKGSLGQPQTVIEVVGGVECRGEPVTSLEGHLRWVELLAVQCDGGRVDDSLALEVRH